MALFLGSAPWLAGWLGWLGLFFCFSWIYIDFLGFSKFWCQNVPNPSETWEVPDRQAAAPYRNLWLAVWLAGWAGWLAGLAGLGWAGWLSPGWLAGRRVGWTGFSWIYVDFGGFGHVWYHNVPKPGKTWEVPNGEAATPTLIETFAPSWLAGWLAGLAGAGPAGWLVVWLAG